MTKREIMKRAWEIKKDIDLKTKNMISVIESRPRNLKEEEKAVFGECLKMAWQEAKEESDMVEKLEVSHEEYLKIAEKKTELLLAGEYGIKFIIWHNYGKKRAYWKCASYSKYQDSKKDHYINLA